MKAEITKTSAKIFAAAFKLHTRGGLALGGFLKPGL
jgi:hypothetical protein